MSKASEGNQFSQPHIASEKLVFDYIDTLLDDGESLAVNEEAAKIEPTALEQPQPQPQTQPESVASPSDPAIDEASPEEVVDSIDSTEAATPQIIQPDQIHPISMTIQESTATCTSDKATAQSNAVLIKISGLSLAIPFDLVDGALHMSTLSLTLTTNHDWIIGHFNSPSSETNIVDSAKVLLPEKYNAQNINYHEVVLLKGRVWALACDEICKSVRIDEDKITFAENRGSRPWLLGTYMPERCAIIDVDALIQMLHGQMQACSA